MRLNTAMNENITARVSVEEKQALAEAARRKGLTITSFVRKAAISAAQQLDKSREEMTCQS